MSWVLRMRPHVRAHGLTNRSQAVHRSRTVHRASGTCIVKCIAPPRTREACLTRGARFGCVGQAAPEGRPGDLGTCTDGAGEKDVPHAHWQCACARRVGPATSREQTGAWCAQHAQCGATLPSVTARAQPWLPRSAARDSEQCATVCSGNREAHGQARACSCNTIVLNTWCEAPWPRTGLVQSAHQLSFV